MGLNNIFNNLRKREFGGREMREVSGLSELELLGLNLGERKRGTMLCLNRKEGRKAQ